MSEPRRITERYRLEKRVSSKDSGSVFRAVDMLSGEVVAVKLINTGESEESREPFEAHAAALQGVQHPTLPRILDFGLTTAGSSFLVTEYLAGDDLSDLVDAPPTRVLPLLVQLTEGLEALAAHGLTARNLDLDNLRIVPGPQGEQVKILGLGGVVRTGDAVTDGPRADLRAFARLAIRALNLPDRGDETVSLPLHVASSLTEPERLRELLDAAQHGDPAGQFPDWNEVRQALRTALFGATGRRPEAKTQMFAPPPPPPAAGSTAQIPRKPTWEEVRLGQGPPPVPWEEAGDTTMAIDRLGPAPAPGPQPSRWDAGTAVIKTTPGGTLPAVPHPAPPAVPELTTRVFRPEELAPPQPPASPATPVAPAPVVPTPPPAAPPGGTVRIEMPGRALGEGGRQGTVRIPMQEIEKPSPVPPLRFPAAAPPPPPAPPPATLLEETLPRRGSTLPFPAPTPPPAAAAPSPTPPPLSPPLPAPSRSVPAPTPPVPVAATPPPVQAMPPLIVPQPTVLQPVLPQPMPASAPQAARPTAPRRPPGKGLRLALLVGVPAFLFLVVVVGLVAWLSRRSAQPEPPQKQVQAPALKPIPPPAPPPPAPAPLNAQILLAEEALNASDLAGAKTALDAIPPEQIALFTSEEQERYQRARDALTPLQSQEWGASLERGLKTGDLRLLRAAAASPPDAATVTPEQKKGLARARKILDLDSKLSKAQRAKNHPETLRQAGLLLAELPDNTRARQARTQAADALLAEADARAGKGELDAALASLEQLREEWNNHPGLAERLERLRGQRRENDQMEEALAAATRFERAERPLEGIQALDRVRPNERFAERFRQARERLQAQFAQLDQNPPQIAMTGPSELSYKEQETVTIPLRITDDQSVESTEAWVRPEGGKFTKVSVRHVGGSDYALEIGPALHQRKSIDFYLTATDQSGHEGTLGSVQRPQKIKRKGWLSKVLGGKDER